ncbi:MAG: Maf family nucleotide pyrophosphatase [Aestuariivirga sp.]
MQNSELILASTSKTRQLLLSNAGISFTAQQPLVNEKELQRELIALSPQLMVVELARAKALSVSLVHPQAFVIGADQILAFENRSMHKANNLTEARLKLQRLRGNTHHLFSSFACAYKGQIIHAEIHSASLVMRNFSDEFIDQYLKTSGKDILASVGCYFFEGLGIQLFETVEGDYSTILGLPILPLLAFLRRSSIIAS